jgi:hypothetical protein
MDVRASASGLRIEIDLDRSIRRAGEAEQIRLARSAVTTDARALGHVRGHDQASAGASGAAVACDSDLMSMRQPVSRAASRAFCPSLPIASDSW